MVLRTQYSAAVLNNLVLLEYGHNIAKVLMRDCRAQAQLLLSAQHGQKKGCDIPILSALYLSTAQI